MGSFALAVMGSFTEVVSRCQLWVVLLTFSWVSQSYIRLGDSDVTLKDMGEVGKYLTAAKQCAYHVGMLGCTVYFVLSDVVSFRIGRETAMQVRFGNNPE